MIEQDNQSVKSNGEIDQEDWRRNAKARIWEKSRSDTILLKVLRRDGEEEWIRISYTVYYD